MLKIRSASTYTGVLVILWVAAAWVYPLLDLSENQALYTFSSEAQVIAAVYGLTITGYIFLRNQQDRAADRDETLIEILDSIQGEQYRLIAFITAISLSSILAALLAIIWRESSVPAARLLTQNSAAALFCSSLVWTGFFVLDAMRPDKIAKASQAIKTAVEEVVSPPPERRGNLEVFLLNFNAIEQLLEDFARSHLDRPSTSLVAASFEPRRSARSAWTKPKIVRAMVSQEVIRSPLANALIELIRYRNAVVHGQDMSVSVDMVDRVTATRTELEEEIQRYIGVGGSRGEEPGV